MPQGIGYPKASSFSSFGRKKKKDEEPLKKKGKKFPSIGSVKKNIQDRADALDEALRKANSSEDEEKRRRRAKEKEKSKEKEKK